MSESESEAEYKTKEEGPIFPYEKLYYDAADKARIQAKPEIERERTLAERSEQVERHEQDLTLRRLVAARAKEEAKNVAKNKRKAAAADLEESQRKSSRQRTKLGGGRAGEASTAIEAYKQQRAEKSQRDEQRRRDAATRRAASVENEYSDPDAEAESDNEYDNHRYKRRSPTPPKDEPIVELADIQRAKIGRDNFAQVCYYPGFEETIKDCYARVCLGPGQTPGVNEYRLCLIKGFTTGRPYAMVGTNGRPFPVNKYILAAHGKAEKSWSFLECSMSPFTEAEWRRYRVVMMNEDCRLPTKKMINSKLDQINALLKHRFTEAEISEKMKKQRDLEAQVFRTHERDDIKEKILTATHAGDWDLVDELQQKLTSILPMKLAFNTTLNRPENTHVNREQEKLAELNRRNQKLNAENVRKAQLAEMRSRRTKKHLAPGVDELFEGGSDISRSGTPVNGQSTPRANGLSRAGTPNPVAMANGTSRTSTPVPMLLKPVSKDKRGIPQIRKAATDDEIIAAMDLGIDIDI
jgi:RNA polymerase-associated protein RTF1